nr:Uncharacterised protein [Klebsiella pneumoniae]
MAEAAFVEMGMMDKGAVSAAAGLRVSSASPARCRYAARHGALKLQITAAQRRLNALTDMKLSGIKY